MSLLPLIVLSPFLSISTLPFPSPAIYHRQLMAAGLSAAIPAPKPIVLSKLSPLFQKPAASVSTQLFFSPSSLPNHHRARRRKCFTVYLVLEEQKQKPELDILQLELDPSSDGATQISNLRAAERRQRKRSERFNYLVAAVVSTLGITSMAVYCRYSTLIQGGDIPLSEMFGTFAVTVGAAVGMEFWSRWVHRAIWHASLWHIHESHHRPRVGSFELNDVFAIVNAVPAIALLYYGFFHEGLIPGLCFGAGLGITVVGMAYVLVHDGLVHSRFPVGPIANVAYFRKVAAAHKVHHSGKFSGVPYGFFLGPKELEEVGGLEELENKINRRVKSYKGS